MQESLNFLPAAKTFPKKESRDAIGLANLTPDNAAAIQIFARRYNPSVLHRNQFNYCAVSDKIRTQIALQIGYFDSVAPAVFSGNSKPTFPSSSFRYAEKGRPRLEMNPSRRSVFPVVRSFCACSFAISRPRIVLLSLNLQGFRSACECSQM